ncbi:hypothetical protein SETIT_3G369400v2 [Setaria italica]|uniref:Uncharacterized protein n=1 Tax=Setaria italica TaxID=4555 RepID=A0A368QMT3_SETIT|nr:hypothetical protein SETIT_3G369400v2 [Setaria italica]
MGCSLRKFSVARCACRLGRLRESCFLFDQTSQPLRDGRRLHGGIPERIGGGGRAVSRR